MRALISVSDKTNIVSLAQDLIALGIEIISTGGSAKILTEANIPVSKVSDITGFPEMLGGRVKTLHPKIFAGLLVRKDRQDDLQSLAEHNIQTIDIVIVNLYPFAEVAKNSQDQQKIIENIDIGGPSMIRAAAKNYPNVLVVVEQEDYQDLINRLKNNNINPNFRLLMAKKAFEHTASYEQKISLWFNQTLPKNKESQTNELFPQELTIKATRKQILRYGENPHQQAAFYVSINDKHPSIANAVQLQGKELSYNNIMDVDAALSTINSFSKKPTCVIIKHANPCGIAQAQSMLKSYQLAFECDKESAFGGILAFNGLVDEQTVTAIINNQFFEIIIAPNFSQQALKILQNKANVRVLQIDSQNQLGKHSLIIRQVQGGLLYQQNDYSIDEPWTIVTQKKPTKEMMEEAQFAWNAVRNIKSNAIVYARNHRTLGIGCGQTSRLMAHQLAQIKANQAGFDLSNSVLASDAFFPFKDNIQKAVEVGVALIVQTGGSINDKEIIDEANSYNISMIFTHHRCFTH